MIYLRNKINRFNTIFTKEEKLVIILDSLVTIIIIVLIWIVTIKAIMRLTEMTAPMFEKALNDLVGEVLPGRK